MRGYFSELHRVHSVAYRIRVANRSFCRDRVAAQIGVSAAAPQSLPRRFRSFASEALDLSWARATAVSVVDGSPAAQAGIRDHDEIISLNGELIPVTGTAGWMDKWLKKNGETEVSVNLCRNGENKTVTVKPVIGCSIPIQYVTSDEATAYTDDEKIVIYSGIMALAKTDAQLATIIGHELGHVWLQHRRKHLVNAVIGTVAGAAVDGSFLLGALWTNGAFTREFQKAGLRAYSVAFEREADYVGAYFAARAGYELTGAEEIWWTMWQTHPDSLRFARTHPLAPLRFVQMKRVAAEIAEKQRNHLPLGAGFETAGGSASERPCGHERSGTAAGLSASAHSHFVAWQSFSNSGQGRYTALAHCPGAASTS
jgi:peptidase M48-like protein/PDZ domain-containing protein